jgi:CheY-like chemotaxis protein
LARILIIDDEEPVRVMLRQMLEREGHEVAEGTCGREGLALYRQRPADLVITDILMPETGGLVAISELRAEFPDARIVAISGGGRDGRLNFLATARTFPGVRTLRKPFSRADLLEAVNALLPN